MSRVVVLGGCGAVGSVVSTVLSRTPDFDEVLIADGNLESARKLAQALGTKVSASSVDAMDGSSVRSVVRGSDVVVNCVGPFYKTAKIVVEAVLAEGINYVDVCDDVDATLDLLALHDKARSLGVTALIGMGASPGITNVLARFAAENLLDETVSIDIFHAHGGEPVEGAGVIGHRFHCMSVDIPMYLDGELKTVRYFEPDGIALRQTFDFPILGQGIKLYPYPHPEQLTIPRTLSLRQVTNKGTVLPDEYYDLTGEVCRLGLAGKEPIVVGGQEVIPHDFSVAFILRERERILKETNFGNQRGCCSVVAKGTKDGVQKEYRFHMASENQALGEGTGIPAAMGAILMKQGKISGPGVLPPEACVDPMDVMSLIAVVKELGGEGGGSFGGLLVQEIGPDGAVVEESTL